jgi:hypothetical protein
VTVLRRHAVRVACPTPPCCTAGPIGIGPTGGPSSRSCVGSRQGVSSTQALRRPLSGPVAAGRPQSRSAKTPPVEQVLPGADGAGLTNLQYAPPAEITGHSPHIAQATLNCAAPDTGNIELSADFRQLRTAKALAASLLDGEIRSAFAMTEPAVAFGCAQRRHQHRPRRRQLRDQRAQMVHLRCAEPPLRRQAWPRSGGCAPPGPPSARARRC